MGLQVEQAYSSLRFTLGDFTTKDDLDYVIDVLVETVSKLRNLSPHKK